MAETTVETNARQKREAKEASDRKRAAAGALPGALQEAQDLALGSLDGVSQRGSANIRRAGAEQLASAVSGAPQTGLGSRLAAARSIGERGLTAESNFAADQVSRESKLRMQGAEKIAQAEGAASDVEREEIKFQKELATDAEDKTARTKDALDDINSKIGDFDDFFTEDEEGAT